MSSTVFAILKQIVIDYPALNMQERLNTFFVLDKAEDWNAENFGRDYRDQNNGFFWTRTGVDPHNNSAGYSALAVETKKFILQEFEKDKNRRLCQTFFITVGDQPVCIDCPDEQNRSDLEVDISNLKILLNVIVAFYKYRFYGNIQNADNEQQPSGFLSPERKTYLENLGWTILDECHSIEDMIMNDAPPEMIVSEFGVDNIRTLTTEIKLCDCWDDLVVFAIDNTLPAEEAVVRCDSCG